LELEWLRRYALQFLYVTEQVQWEHDLLLKVGGKMFLAMPLEPARVVCSFKCSPESFAELTERLGVIPAPYLARASWVALERANAIPAAELKALVKRSYELVWEKLPKKTRTALKRSPAAEKSSR
jgi:predicted DNA-binding protein (MmcQ/YjbR family)